MSLFLKTPLSHASSMTIQPARFTIKNNEQWIPHRVFLFSGHMIDTAGRASPRFPIEKVSLATQTINHRLTKLHAGANDLAITQGANGGDILFAEACIEHNMQLQFLQPFCESEFIQNSVSPGGEDWQNRYQAIRQQTPSLPLAAPEQLGPLPNNMNAYERCNLWLLNTALSYGTDKLIFICLWDGGDGNGPGGTAHMVEEVKKQQGQIEWLNPNKLN